MDSMCVPCCAVVAAVVVGEESGHDIAIRAIPRLFLLWTARAPVMGRLASGKVDAVTFHVCGGVKSVVGTGPCPSQPAGGSRSPAKNFLKEHLRSGQKRVQTEGPQSPSTSVQIPLGSLPFLTVDGPNHGDKPDL